jgi:uncharacterized protein involved in exopolysaccharide biosynthesis
LEIAMASGEGRRPGTSLKQVLHVMFKHRTLILACVICSIALAKAAELVLHKPVYSATTQLLIAPGREHVADFSLPTGGAVPPWVRFSADEEMARTTELLTGRSLVERVVREIGPAVLYPPVPPGRWQVLPWMHERNRAHRDDELEAAIARFIDKLSAQPAGRASIIHLNFEHPDPDMAARAVNLLAVLYVERYLGVYRDDKAEAFFEEQFIDVKRKLREAEQALLDFKQRHRITSSVSEEQVFLRAMLASLQGELNETLSRQAELRSHAGELRKQMQQHGTMYGNLRDELQRNAAEAGAVRAREADVGGKVANLQARLGELERLRDAYNDLDSQLKAEQDSYKLYLNKFQESRLSGAMDKRRIASVRVIEPAHRPRNPVRSKLESLVLFSVPLGLFGGIALAFALQWVRGTMDTPADVERVLELPVLASLPGPKGVGGMGG